MTVTFHSRIALVTPAAVLLAACSSDNIGPSPIHAPELGTPTIAAEANNVLSALVSTRAAGTDSVAVLFKLGDGTSSADTISPATKTVGDSVTIAVLGLLPSRRYTMRTVGYWSGGRVLGDPVDMTTGTLPVDLPHYTASGSSPSPGYVVFAAGLYGIVIDNTGRVVWYHRFANGPGLSFMAEPNGRYVARPTTADPTDVEPWIEIDSRGNVTRTLLCALGLTSRPHDFIAQPDGSYWLMCDDVRTIDLSASGGSSQARVTATAVQHLRADGTVLFHWTAFDHFELTDLPLSDRAGPTVNWTHGNAIDLDADGNLLVSFRNLSEITKIDTKTGDVIWRMGGARNQFAFIDSPAPPFLGQHGARTSSLGQLTVLDNIGDPSESRSRHFTFDELTLTARLTRSHSSVPGASTLIGGSVQNVAGGHTLVSFGTAGRVEEYDAQGQVVWKIEGNAGYVFRAQRILSLYAPGVGTSR